MRWLKTGLVVVIGVVVLGFGLLYVMANPLGPRYHNCIGRADATPGQVTQDGIVFEGVAGIGGQQVFTEAFVASAPWTIEWESAGDGFRIDLYDANATVPPEARGNSARNAAGKVFLVQELIGERQVDATGRFCMTIQVYDLLNYGIPSGGIPPEGRTPGREPRSLPWRVTVTTR
jgi:hypothetical protein